jgi:hypothetical protein
MTSPDPQISIPELNAVAAAFAVERQVSLSELARFSCAETASPIEDKEKIAAGLLLSLSLVIGQAIDGIKIEKIEKIYPPTLNQGLIDFKLSCCRADLMQVQLGICVLPFTSPSLVNAACNRLLVYKDFGLDRLCLLCPSDLSTSVNRLPVYFSKLLSTDIGGHFIAIDVASLEFILTTLSVFQHKHTHEITNELIFAYVRRERLAIENESIRSIVLTARS